MAHNKWLINIVLINYLSTHKYVLSANYTEDSV